MYFLGMGAGGRELNCFLFIYILHCLLSLSSMFPLNIVENTGTLEPMRLYWTDTDVTDSL
uniref:Uncharacterized protein n=1 Tax=Anguilla anguilla TaxID=7936 RepID=A0A0E9WR27_ANGAN